MENLIQIDKSEIQFLNQLDQFIGIENTGHVYAIDEIKLKGEYGTTGGKWGERCVKLGGTTFGNLKIEEMRPQYTYFQFSDNVNNAVNHFKNLGYSQNEISLQYLIDFDSCEGKKFGQIRCIIKTSISKKEVCFPFFFSNSYSSEYGDTTYSFSFIYVFTNECYTKQKNDRGLSFQKQFGIFLEKYYSIYIRHKNIDKPQNSDKKNNEKPVNKSNIDSDDSLKVPLILVLIIFSLLFYFERGMITLIFFFIGSPLLIFSYRLRQGIKGKL
jgi:hypothetical protein